MPAFYVETGSLLKRYLPERGSDVLHELLDEQRQTDVFTTSRLTYLELNAVMARLLKGRALRRRRYDALFAALTADVERCPIEVLPLEDRHVLDALELYPEHPLRAPDALHFIVALSVQERVGADDFCLVCGDAEIVAAARAARMRLIDPEAAGALESLRALR